MVELGIPSKGGSRMTTETKEVRAVGDWDLRFVDFETRLIGPITASIIDADRLVRAEFNNGFPNWYMYRTALAGDTHALGLVKDWCIAFAIACGESGGLRKPSDDIAVCVGRDAYIALLTSRWGAPSDEIANALEISPKTYRRFRNAVFRRLKASLDEYWLHMQIAIRQVAKLEAREEQATPISVYSKLDPRTGISRNGTYLTGIKKSEQ